MTYRNLNQFGGDFGDDAPTPANQMKAWQEKQATKQREALLYPNRGSSAKIQRYCFAINYGLQVGTPDASLVATGKPETEFRPQRITANVPSVGFIMIESLKVANVGVIVGGEVDAFDFSANGSDQELDVPTLTPANEVKVTGEYTGIDSTLTNGDDFLFCLSFKGPATMAGG